MLRESHREVRRESHRAIGLELPGGKHGRAVVAVLDAYPKSRKLILSELLPSKSKQKGDLSQDEQLVAELARLADECARFDGLGVAGPLTLPSGLFEGPRSAKDIGRAMDAEARWAEKVLARLRPRPRPFAPYLQRACEVWLRHLTPEKFQITDALGSNAAPLAARLAHLRHVLPETRLETLPKAGVVRIAKSLGMPKWLAFDHADLEKGVHAREEFLIFLSKKLPQIFVYDHDLEAMILHLNHFHAFISALTVHLAAAKQTDEAPKGFPKEAAWIHIPRNDVDWSLI